MTGGPLPRDTATRETIDLVLALRANVLAQARQLDDLTRRIGTLEAHSGAASARCDGLERRLCRVEAWLEDGWAGRR
ncbi:MAG: hypothetical protein ACFE0R_19755 [Salinarimonas sp.]